MFENTWLPILIFIVTYFFLVVSVEILKRIKKKTLTAYITAGLKIFLISITVVVPIYILIYYLSGVPIDIINFILSLLFMSYISVLIGAVIVLYDKKFLNKKS